MKKVFVKTYGCQMNVYDSERMIEALAPVGYEHTDAIEQADVIVLNTCHIREKAAEKVYSELGRIRQVKADRLTEGKRTTVAVAGCVAQAEGQEILDRAAVVDIVIGPQSYQQLPGLIFEAETQARKILKLDFPERDKFQDLPKRAGPRQASAFLTVQEGCDKFCTFCVVPYTRGMEFSRPVADVLHEARALVAGGVRELTLLGQNVNAYHGEGSNGKAVSLARLLAELAEIDGLERLRYTTSHPNDMTDDLIAAHRDNPKLMPYLHLPFQAGADRILAGMNRKHTASSYRLLIDRIRAARPDIALSTDIIVGFPGETENEFGETLRMVEDIGFAQAYSFKYSPRPGTPAAMLEDQIAEEVQSERLQRLQALLEVQQSRFNASCVGLVLPVLFERPGRDNGQLVGRSPYLQAVHATAAETLLGGIHEVEISVANRHSLTGIVRPAFA
ncbi:MAG: tRNA (N6-isopentenyl adenosine(37)-C2)-methylthiotransferase MiaB [Alphaproteobacteria bacterium]|nr:tRNA (N6-isopentenyl adenosine(37)-C2)-methylthiotransferase MiaB [Alphaproteobacteria bacterium]